MQRLFLTNLLVLATLVACSGTRPVSSTSDDRQVADMLDRWYDAARMKDPHYFDYFTQDAVFLGTDPDERWTLKDFRQKYPTPSWDYKAMERYISFSSDHKVGWFDERLQRKPDFGPMRATGVIVNIEGAWKIAEYNLTFLVPNGVFSELARNQVCLPIWTVRCGQQEQQPSQK